VRRIGDLLDHTLKRFRLGERVRAHRAIGEWAEIVGPQVAGHARPTEVAGTTLVVQVDHSAWLAQLRLLSPVILERLNARLGEGTIRDIALRIGSAPPPRPPDASSAAAPEAPPRLSPEEAGEIDRAIADVSDPSLRALLLELREKQDPDAERVSRSGRPDPSGEK
jgi:hypothetical protein